MAALTLPCTGVGKTHMCVLCPRETMAGRFAHVLLWLQGPGVPLRTRSPDALGAEQPDPQDPMEGPKLPVAALIQNPGP